jgi:putative addiction module component (TIGR02574 family)
MFPTLKSYGLEDLPVDDKLSLVEELWESIAADEAALPVPPSHLAELQRRLAENQSPADELQTWEEVKCELDSEP